MTSPALDETRRRKVGRGLLLITSAAIVPAALLALGTFSSQLPYLGTAGTYVFTRFAGPAIPLMLIAVVVAIAATRAGSRRLAPVLALLGCLTLLGAWTVVARHLEVAHAHGIDVSAAAAMIPRGIGTGAQADETAAYTTTAGKQLLIDIFRSSARREGLAPVAMYIHGGGWILGTRSGQAANLRWLADRGFVAMSPDYSLATPEQATWNTAGSDVGCAVAWAVANAARYGGDPQRLFLYGESAGGALALNVAYATAARNAAYSCGAQAATVRAVAAQVPAVDPAIFYDNPDPIFGRLARRMVSRYLGGRPAEYPERARAVSSMTHVTPHAPPTLIVLSDGDHLVPVEGALRFVERARESNVALTVVRFPLADHGSALQYYSVFNQAWLRLLVQHFCRHGGACG